MTQLQQHLESLQKAFPGRVQSVFMVGRNGKMFEGFHISCEPIVRDWYMRKVGETIGFDFRIEYMPNQEVIVIQ